MNSSTDLSWVPTNISSSLRYTNCTLAGDWGATLYKARDFGMLKSALFLQHGLASYVGERNITVEYADLLVLIATKFAANDPTILQSMVDFTFSKCLDQVCPRIGFQGYSDLAGRGMLVNYLVQAVLTTVYPLTLAATRLRLMPTVSEAGSKRFLPHAILAIQHSTRIFLDTSILFCIALLISAAWTFADSLSKPKIPLTTYSVLTSAFLSLYSIIPTVLLHTCASNNLRRTRRRRIVWIIIAGLAVVVIALYLSLPYMPERYNSRDFEYERLYDPDSQIVWEALCLDQATTKIFTIAVRILITTLSAGVLLYVLVDVTSRRINHAPFQKLRAQWWLFAASVCLIGMWVSLAAFVYFREKLNERSGSANKDHEWTFGQLLALVTWVPVFVELVVIWKQGPKTALTGQLMEPYRVVSHAGVSSSLGDNDMELLRYKPISSFAPSINRI